LLEEGEGSKCGEKLRGIRKEWKLVLEICERQRRYSLSSGDMQKLFFNDLLFSIAYFIMFSKVLAAVLKHPV
jgi:hypothetical protein